MADLKRTVLWMVLILSLVMLWDAWNRHNGEPTLFGVPAAATATSPATSPAASPAAAAGIAAAPLASAATPAAVASAAGPAEPIERVTIANDVLRLTLTSRGGEVAHAELLHYLATDAQGNQGPMVLLDASSQRVYLAQSGYLNTGGQALPNHFTTMHMVSGPTTLAPGQDSLSVRFESPLVGHAKAVKTYTLHRGSYVVDVKQELVNEGGTSLRPQLYLQLTRDGTPPPGTSKMYFTFTGPAIYTDEGKFQKVDFSDIEKRKPGEAPKHETSSTQGWVAMVQHYFVSAWWLPQPAAVGEPREFRTAKVANNLYSVALVEPLGELAPGASVAREAQLYIGPQLEKRLEALTPGLELVKDYGFLHILAKPLFWLLDKLHAALGNWGWAIVALVVLLKAAFFQLNATAYKSMAKMKAVNPRIQALRERLKEKPQEMQQEMMRIYREEKINPLGGCLPILVQMPFFIALYWVLLSSVEMRGASWVGWIHDLAQPDALFGVLPILGMPIGPLPLLMTGSSLLMQWLQPTPADPIQARMMWLMPLMFSFMFFYFPAGLVLYWLTNNLLSIAQQWLINKKLGVA